MPDGKEVTEILDILRIGRGSTGKGGCWCWKADPTKTGPAFDQHTPTCVRVAAFYGRLGVTAKTTKPKTKGD